MSQDKNTCCNQQCNQGRTCPLRAGTNKPEHIVENCHFDKELPIGFVAETAGQAAPAESISDTQIDAVFEKLPDGAQGFLKSWGYRQFAREILALHAVPEREVRPDEWFTLKVKPQAAPAAVAVPKCPFPCGWENLHKLAVAEGAFLANSLREDEPLTEHQRDTVMRVVNYSIEMARAALAATPAEVECEAATVERILNKGEQLENRVYWLSRPVNINQPSPPADASHGRAYCATKAAAPVVLPEPDARNHGGGIVWNRSKGIPPIDGDLFTADTVRALLATGGQAQAVERSEVLVTVSGFTGSGKSAIAGEIEILCRTLGLQVECPDGDSEKNMTHADWTAALEQYKPRVRIVEQNLPFAAMKGMSK